MLCTEHPVQAQAGNQHHHRTERGGLRERWAGFNYEMLFMSLRQPRP